VSFANGLPVVFCSAETIVVDRVTWPVYDRNSPTKVVGTRTQLPLKLAWQSQGQTLHAVEVHSGKNCPRSFVCLVCRLNEGEKQRSNVRIRV